MAKERCAWCGVDQQSQHRCRNCIPFHAIAFQSENRYPQIGWIKRGGIVHLPIALTPSSWFQYDFLVIIHDSVGVFSITTMADIISLPSSYPPLWDRSLKYSLRVFFSPPHSVWYKMARSRSIIFKRGNLCSLRAPASQPNDSCSCALTDKLYKREGARGGILRFCLIKTVGKSYCMANIITLLLFTSHSLSLNCHSVIRVRW